MFHPSPIFARAWILAFFVASGGGGILWMSHSWKRRSWNRCDAIRWGSPCDRRGGRPTPWGEVVTCRTEMFCDFCQEVRLLGGVGVENTCLQLYWCSFTIWLSFCDQLLQFYSGDILILPKDTYNTNTDRSYNSEILPYSRGDCFRCFIARPGWAGSAIAVFRVDQGGSDGSRWKNSKEKAAVHPSLRFGHWVWIVPEVEEISLGSRCIGKLWSAEAQCNIPSMFLMPLLPECRIFGSRVWQLMIWGCPKFSIPDFANNIWDVRGPQVSNMFPLETHDIILIVSLMRWQVAGNIIVFPNDWWMPDPHMLAMPGTWHGIKMMWWLFQHANSLNKDTRWQRMLRHLFWLNLHCCKLITEIPVTASQGSGEPLLCILAQRVKMVVLDNLLSQRRVFFQNDFTSNQRWLKLCSNIKLDQVCFANSRQ